MKTALIIALTAALVFAAALGQFRARKAESQATQARAAEQRVREFHH